MQFIQESYNSIIHWVTHEPVPPDAPLTMTLRGESVGLGNQSRHANAVRETSGTEAAASGDRDPGFLAMGSELGLTFIY